MITYLQEQVAGIDWVMFGSNFASILAIVASMILWFNRNFAKFAVVKGQAKETENMLIYVKAILKDSESTKAFIKKTNKDVMVEVGALKVELYELRNAIKKMTKDGEK